MSTRKAEPYVPSEAEKVGALSDVAYELEQIRDLLKAWPSTPGLQQNAWIEAILVHARQLLDFFEEPRRFVRSGKEEDDILAVDFGFVAAPVAVPKTFRLRLNKDLAHLSYSRQGRVRSQKMWHFSDLAPLLVRGREFAEHVVEAWSERLDPTCMARWKGLARMRIVGPSNSELQRTRPAQAMEPRR